MNEIWELRDAEGNKAGISLPREDRDKIPEGLYLPCVEVWVTVGEKLLITRRHPRKSEGLKYEVSGGGARFGEELPDAALRELHEEVGIEARRDSLIYLGFEVCGDVYAASYLLPLDAIPKVTLQQSEVVEWRLVDERELREMKDSLTEGTYRRYLLYGDKIFRSVAI